MRGSACYPDQVLGIDRRAASVTWTVFLISLFVMLIWLVRAAITMMLVALFLAYILYPLVDFVSRITPKRVSRTASLAFVYVSLILTIVVLGVWIGTEVVAQASALAQQFPQMVQKAGHLDTVPLPTWVEPMRERIAAFIQEQTATGFSRIGPVIQRAVGGVAGLLGGLGYTVLVPVLAFLFLKDAVGIREYLLGWVPHRNRGAVDDIMEDLHKLLAQYIRALVILSGLTGVLYGVFFSIVGLPYALLIAATAAILEFIPYIGPAVGTVMVLIVAVFTGFPHILWLVIFFLVYRAIQDYVIQPHLLASGTELHPLVVFFGAFAGEALGGLWGMFICVPVLAGLRIILVRVAKHQVGLTPASDEHQLP